MTLPMEEDKELYTMYDERVLSSLIATNLSHLEPCDHKEADTHIMVHVCDACLSGHCQILIRTYDTCCCDSHIHDAYTSSR